MIREVCCGALMYCVDAAAHNNRQGAGEKWSATKWIHVSSSSTTKQQQQAGWEGSRRADSNDSTTQRLASRLGLCTDVDPECSSWAEDGECSKNPEYMALKCQKSCNKC